MAEGELTKKTPELHPDLAKCPQGPFKTLFLKLNLHVFADEDEVIVAIDGPVSNAEYLVEIEPDRLKRWTGSKPEPFAFDIFLTQFVLEMELAGLDAESQSDLAHARNIADALVRDREIQEELTRGKDKKGVGLSGEWSASAKGPAGKLGLSMPVTSDKSETRTTRFKTTAKDLSFDAYVGATGNGPVWTFVSRIGEADKDMADALEEAEVKIEALIGSFPKSFLARLARTNDGSASVKIRVRPHLVRQSLHVRPSKDQVPSFMKEDQQKARAVLLRKRLEKKFREEGIMTISWSEEEDQP